ncbi:hypothetical protein SUGI_0290870 [Cryptomeria japonica]|nr:hypothetical protein SUGI_0290870 [Cryptomeria japonica]
MAFIGEIKEMRMQETKIESEDWIRKLLDFHGYSEFASEDQLLVWEEELKEIWARVERAFNGTQSGVERACVIQGTVLKLLWPSQGSSTIVKVAHGAGLEVAVGSGEEFKKSYKEANPKIAQMGSAAAHLKWKWNLIDGKIWTNFGAETPIAPQEPKRSEAKKPAELYCFGFSFCFVESHGLIHFTKSVC